MYTAIHICSDISFALKWLSQYFSDSAEHHGQVLKELLQYVCSIIDFNITYKSSESQNLIKYSDSDYTSDKQNQRSIFEQIYMLSRESISWASLKQKSVVTSTTKTEYMIMFTCAKTGIWLIQILTDIKLSKYLDSNSWCIQIHEDKVHRANSSL